MPLVRIEILKGKSSAFKKTLLDEIHAAKLEALKLPDTDRHQRLVELDPDWVETPPGRSNDYTLVEITMFPGRTREAKKALYAGIVERLQKRLGIPPADVMIVLHEPPLENWGIRGGKPAEEVNLGFKLEV